MDEERGGVASAGGILGLEELDEHLEDELKDTHLVEDGGEAGLEATGGVVGDEELIT